MINDVISGVCKVIREEFGQDYAIYTEQTEQAARPCFYVYLAEDEITRLVGRRYDIKHSIGITYVPEEGDSPREEIHDVALRLMDVLEYIDLDGPTEGTNIKSSVIYDEVPFLSCSVDYKYTIYKKPKEEETLMKKLKQEQRVKGGE